jgi:transcriptional regulator with XRE-family HTH domain
MTQDHFPGRLRELREAMGWSQSELAERAGLHLQTVSRFERGTLKPTWEAVLALAGPLGVDCLAFCQAPAVPHKHRGPGRPRKDTTEGQGQRQAVEPAKGPAKGQRGKGERQAAARRRPRGRPRKAE